MGTTGRLSNGNRISKPSRPAHHPERPWVLSSRQVINIISKVVTEYRAEIVEDAQGHQFIAEFPTGVTRPVQYGHSVKAQSVYMSQQQLVPYDRIRDYFGSVRHPDQPRLRFNFTARLSVCWRPSGFSNADSSGKNFSTPTKPASTSTALACGSIVAMDPARGDESHGCFAPLRWHSLSRSLDAILSIVCTLSAMPITCANWREHGSRTVTGGLQDLRFNQASQVDI